MSYVGLYEDAGSRNTFYRLKNKRGRGFKGFESKDEAVFAHKIQSKLSDLDMAPRVYSVVGRIMVPDYCSDDMILSNWGYVTEIARTLPDCYDDDCDGDCYDSGCKNSYLIDQVVEAMNEVGLEYVDAHRGNFGYIRRNRQWIPVVIDVGRESFDYVDESIYGEYLDQEPSCNCSFCQRNRNI
jgi:hypothetical protein